MTRGRCAAGKRGLFLKLLLGSCMAIFWMYGLSLSLSLPVEERVWIFFTGSYPGKEQAEEILELEQKQDHRTELCFYGRGGIEEAVNDRLGRRAWAVSEVLYGNTGVYHWQARNLRPDDPKGCIIDEQTAIALFGRTKAEGETLRVGKRQLQVCGVTEGKQRQILYLPGEEPVSFTRVFLKCGAGENKEQKAQEFLMKYGLTGVVQKGNMTQGGSLLLAAVLPGMLVGFMGLKAKSCQRECAAFGRSYYVWMGLKWLCAAAVCVLLWQFVKIPADWIPGKWSDFSFWSRKIEELMENWRLRHMLPKTAMELEAYMVKCRIFLSMAASVGCGIGLLGRNHENSKKPVEETGKIVL